LENVLHTPEIGNALLLLQKAWKPWKSRQIHLNRQKLKTSTQQKDHKQGQKANNPGEIFATQAKKYIRLKFLFPATAVHLNCRLHLF